MFQEAMKRLTQLLSKDLGKELYELWEVSASGGLRGAWTPGAGGVSYEAQPGFFRQNSPFFRSMYLQANVWNTLSRGIMEWSCVAFHTLKKNGS